VLHRPAYPARVVDRSGAGDAFTAALLGGLYELSLAGPGFWPLAGPDLGRLMDLAATAAGLTCERAGAELPTAAELELAALARSRTGPRGSRRAAGPPAPAGS
jgi:fructokinase